MDNCSFSSCATLEGAAGETTEAMISFEGIFVEEALKKMDDMIVIAWLVKDKRVIAGGGLGVSDLLDHLVNFFTKPPKRRRGDFLLVSTNLVRVTRTSL